MKIKHLIAAIVLMCVSTASFAQFSMGVKGGLAAGWIQGITLLPGDRVMPHNNGFAGVSAEYVIGDVALVEMDVIFAMRGHADRNIDSKLKTSYSIGYLEIPVLGGVSLWDGRANFAVGPQLGVMMFGKVRGDLPAGAVPEGGRIDSYLKRYTCDIVLQGNFMFLPFMGAELKLNYGLTPICDNSKVFPGVENITNGGRNVGVSLGLVFKLRCGSHD